MEDFYNILQQIHNKDCIHAGSKKTFARVRISKNNVYYNSVVFRPTQKCGGIVCQSVFHM